MMNSAASSPAHDRTGRWWRSLGLPTDDGQRSRLRKEYASKLSAHSASKGNDPLSESALESFVREIHRIETARGLSFPAAHPLAGAARSGLLDKAELMAALWFLEHSKEAERATAVARHAVLVLASVLTLQQQQQQQQQRLTTSSSGISPPLDAAGVATTTIVEGTAADSSSSNNSQETALPGDNSGDGADGYLMLDALMNHMNVLLFHGSGGEDDNREGGAGGGGGGSGDDGGDGLFDDDDDGVSGGRGAAPLDTLLEACAAKLLSVDPELADFVNQNCAPITAAAAAELGSTASTAPSSLLTTPETAETEEVTASAAAATNNDGGGGAAAGGSDVVATKEKSKVGAEADSEKDLAAVTGGGDGGTTKTTTTTAAPWARSWVTTLFAAQATDDEALFTLWDLILVEGVGKATVRRAGEVGGPLKPTPSSSSSSSPLSSSSQSNFEEGGDGGPVYLLTMALSDWAECLAPLLCALLRARPRATCVLSPCTPCVQSSNSTTTEEGGALGSGGANFASVGGVVESARLIRDPELLAVRDGAVSVVTFQAGPLGLVLGQKEKDATASAAAGGAAAGAQGNGSGSLSGLRVRKFQVSHASGGSAGSAVPPKPMQAEASGAIQVGDVVAAVNGVPVALTLTPQALVALLGRVGRPVKVAFLRRPQIGGGGSSSSGSLNHLASSQSNGGHGVTMDQRSIAKRRASGIDFDDGSGDALSEARELAGSMLTHTQTLLAGTLDPEVYTAAAAAANHLNSLAMSVAGGGDSSSSSSSSDSGGGGGGGGPRSRQHEGDGGGGNGRTTPPASLMVHGAGHALSGEAGGEGGSPRLDAPFGSMAPITHAEDGFELPCLAGEGYEAQLKVQMLCAQRPRLGDGAGLQKAWVKGQLFVSNFRVYFRSLHKLPSSSSSSSLQQAAAAPHTKWPFDWHIPVHSVERFDSTKAVDSNGPNGLGRAGRTVGLACKDGQLRKFTATKLLSEEKQLTDEFHHFQRKFYQHAFASEDCFARAHCKAVRDKQQQAAATAAEAAAAESGADDAQADNADAATTNPPPPLLERCRLPLQSLTLAADFDRLGLQSYHRKLRLVKQNDLNLCLTYPLELLVPASMQDKDLVAVAKYRSKQRLPVVTWFDVRTGASISRCSQPLVGMNSKRCYEDEKLVRELAALTHREDMEGSPLKCTFYIVDARSKVATRGNQLMGKGVEQVKYYRDGRYAAELTYMNIDNIHAVRDSFTSLQAHCRPSAFESGLLAAGGPLHMAGGGAGGAGMNGGAGMAGVGGGCGGNGGGGSGGCGEGGSSGGGGAAAAASSVSSTGGSWLGKLEASGWLSHVAQITRASNFIVEAVTRDKCSVLVHCSDGWDRTPQLCGLAQLCIDPYYRTLRGFAALVEKEWLSFGHKFTDRSAHSNQQPNSEEKSAVFPLWLDCVFQLMRQFPTVLEFNEDLLLLLLDHLYSCRFGTFLCNSFIERSKHGGETLSVWSLVEEKYDDLLNRNYENYTEGPVLPSTSAKNIVLWEAYFQRFDVSKLPFDPKTHDPKTFYD